MPEKFFTGRFGAVENPAIAAAVAIPSKAPGGKPAKVSKSINLNIRSAANLGAGVIGVLRPGTAINIYATDGKWVRIHPTEERWVASRYVVTP